MVDTHCHLDSCDPPDAELIARARGIGITHLATVGLNGPSIERALEAARAHEEVVAVVGRHPHHSEGFGDNDLDEIERAAQDPWARAIGETGLDYYRDRAPREDQIRAFEAQLALAGRLRLPVVIHTRAAEDDTFSILAEHAAQMTVILHCFSAPDRLEECVERGYFCSFAGNVTFKNADALRRAATEVPEHLLLVETDSPYLAPVPVRGRPNEPANVTHTAELVADLRGVGYEALDATVERNAAGVFGW